MNLIEAYANLDNATKKQRLDEKIPRDCRDNIPLVINKDTREIIWVAGVRQTAVALADENTKQYLILSYREKE